MPAFLLAFGSGVASFFGGIFGFLSKWLVRKAEALPFFLITISINIAFLSLFVLYISAIITFILFVYNKIDDFVKFLNSNSFGISGEISNLIYNILSSAKFFQALHDVSVIFMPVISSIFLIIAYKVGMHFFKFFRESVLSLVISKLT